MLLQNHFVQTTKTEEGEEEQGSDNKQFCGAEPSIVCQKNTQDSQAKVNTEYSNFLCFSLQEGQRFPEQNIEYFYSEQGCDELTAQVVAKLVAVVQRCNEQGVDVHRITNPEADEPQDGNKDGVGKIPKIHGYQKGFYLFPDVLSDIFFGF